MLYKITATLHLKSDYTTIEPKQPVYWDQLTQYFGIALIITIIFITILFITFTMYHLSISDLKDEIKKLKKELYDKDIIKSKD